MTVTDRREAGRALAHRLRAFRGPDVVLLGMPPGGVAVAAEIAAALHVPLDVMIAERNRLLGSLRYLRRFRPRVALFGCTAILVQDAVIEADTVRAAVDAAYARGAVRVVLATPVAARPALDALAGVPDRIVCLAAPDMLEEVEDWYRGEEPPTDAEIRRLLTRSRTRPPANAYAAVTVRTFPWPTSVVLPLAPKHESDEATP
ncbi:phosphoribosyltransferase family protein [Nocardia terrae]|uniref:phosphoribosyltransferase family protein n=1 Tax=Nocardia terrae TaxID=2675851 RepID=UPI0012FCD285|nr:phosphoribosyltransferase family protein [Nocardia terrae]